MGYKYNATIEQDIKEWVDEVLTSYSIVCIQEDQKYRNPQIEGNFASYDIGSPRLYGQDSRQYVSGDNHKYQGIRALDITVTVYADNAMHLTSLLQNSLMRGTILQGFSEKGFSILNIIGTQNITALLDTGYERRGVLEFTIGVNETHTDATSYINTVVQTGIVENENGDEIYNEDITIN